MRSADRPAPGRGAKRGDDPMMRDSARTPVVPRRGWLAALAGAAVLAGARPPRPALAQGGQPLRVGLMLPFSGTFAALGENIASAFEMHLAERGGRMGGRPLQIVRLNDESNPAN